MQPASRFRNFFLYKIFLALVSLYGVSNSSVCYGQWHHRYGAAVEEAFREKNKTGTLLSNREAIRRGNSQLLTLSRERQGRAAFFARRTLGAVSPWIELMQGFPDRAQNQLLHTSAAAAGAPLAMFATALAPCTMTAVGTTFTIISLFQANNQLKERLCRANDILYKQQDPKNALLLADQVYNDAIFSGFLSLGEVGGIFSAGSALSRQYNLSVPQLFSAAGGARLLSPLKLRHRVYMTYPNPAYLTKHITAPESHFAVRYWHSRGKRLKIDDQGQLFVELEDDHILTRMQTASEDLIPFHNKESPRVYAGNKVLNFSDGLYPGTFSGEIDDDLEIFEIPVGPYIAFLNERLAKSRRKLQPIFMVSDPIMLTPEEGSAVTFIVAPDLESLGPEIIKLNTFVPAEHLINAARSFRAP